MAWEQARASGAGVVHHGDAPVGRHRTLDGAAHAVVLRLLAHDERGDGRAALVAEHGDGGDDGVRPQSGAGYRIGAAPGDQRKQRVPHEVRALRVERQQTTIEVVRGDFPRGQPELPELQGPQPLGKLQYRLGSPVQCRHSPLTCKAHARVCTRPRRPAPGTAANCLRRRAGATPSRPTSTSGTWSIMTRPAAHGKADLSAFGSNSAPGRETPTTVASSNTRSGLRQRCISAKASSPEHQEELRTSPAHSREAAPACPPCSWAPALRPPRRTPGTAGWTRPQAVPYSSGARRRSRARHALNHGSAGGDEQHLVQAPASPWPARRRSDGRRGWGRRSRRRHLRVT